jgi:hypothetical protein
MIFGIATAVKKEVEFLINSFFKKWFLQSVYSYA